MNILVKVEFEICKHPLQFGEIEKPCKTADYCPFGILVEYFPLKGKSDGRSCKVFGHDCPAYYLADFVTEEEWLSAVKG